MAAAPTREQRHMTHFAFASGRYICTAELDGSIPLNARIAATIGDKDDRDAAGALVSQANAAPDLLAALKTIADFYREDRDFSGHPHHPIARADAAIAKAEGRS